MQNGAAVLDNAPCRGRFRGNSPVVREGSCTSAARNGRITVVEGEIAAPGSDVTVYDSVDEPFPTSARVRRVACSSLAR